MSPTRRRLAVLLALASLLSACSSILLRTWSDPTREQQAFGRIAVVGFHPRQEVRVQFEDAFAQMLRDRGNDVVASHLLADDPTTIDRNALKRIAADQGVDGVLTAVIMQIDPNADVIPAGQQYKPQLDGDLYEYLLRTRRRLPPPTDQPGPGLLTIEARLYGTGDAKLAWAGISRSQNESEVIKTTKDYAETIIFQLSAKGFVK